MLSKEALRAVSGRKFKTFEIPDVGEVRIASPSARQLLAMKTLEVKRKKGEDVELDVMAIGLECIVDDKGHRVFSAEEVQQRLDSWSLDALGAVLNGMLELSGGEVKKAEAEPKEDDEPAPNPSEPSTSVA